MRSITALAAAGLLAGCAAVPTPHEKLARMDTQAPRYASTECRQARLAALEYDENVGGRVGMGVGVGVLLGPLGLPLAVAADAAQADKRRAILAQLQAACEGERPGGPADVDTLAFERSAALLDELLARGLVSAAEHQARRSLLIDRFLHSPGLVDAMAPEGSVPVRAGRRVRLRDLEPLSGTLVQEAVWTVAAIGADSVRYVEGGTEVGLQDLVLRAGQLAGARLTGFDPRPLRIGDRLQARFHPPGGGDEAVPVTLRVTAFDALAGGGTRSRIARLELDGYASLQGPYGTPRGWLGAEMSGSVEIEVHTGLIVRARVRCAYPSYAMQRELVRVDTIAGS